MRFRCTSIQVKAGLPKTEFCIQTGKTDYVTIAHQDDIYEPNYLKMIFGELKKVKIRLLCLPIMVNPEMEKSSEINAAHDQTYFLLPPMRSPRFQNVRFFKRAFSEVRQSGLLSGDNLHQEKI